MIYPKRVKLIETCSANILPPGKTVLPVGSIGEHWKNDIDMYLFRVFDGYTSYIPARFVIISDKFQVMEE